ncbi:hypothetical protein K1T71_010780 [Dendrolimus kikuchii]|uniref:Uncharacterized protein n=1 Tax=Dendrolimus kikuchii TaxID=765133 RepID=A0ACC1CQ76_9NEOP|nr:hypothetical protein K1T71_010780 [Dendrolimus kikuchii]
MMNQYIKELEQDPFDPDEFVERMVRRSMQESRLQDELFDPEMIHDIFTQAIQDLKVLQERQERKCTRLEQAVQEEEKLYGAKLAEIMDQHTHCVDVFSALDERMSRCGGRALDVGEKLGAARAPRARAAAARDLLSHLAHFLSPGPVLSDLFSDPSKLNDAADVIQKLHTIAQELPPDKFEVAKKKIDAKYDEIERNLIDEFVKAQNQGNMAKMKDIANLMTNFKGYSQCVDAFIETSQVNTLLGKDIFSAVLPLCKKNYTIISNVFPNPDQVMSKFVLNIFHLKLQKYIQTKLADKNDVEKYLKNLYDMYTSTQRVCDELVAAGLISAHGNTTTGDLRREALVNGAMAGANDGYANMETRRLRAMLSNALNSYYLEKQHVKKQIQGGGFQELRRDLQITLYSENRNHTNCAKSVISKVLGNASIAVERGLTPSSTHRPYPFIYFFDIVKQANKIVRMFGEHFQESVLPCTTSTSKQTECIQKKNTIMEQLENKLDAGLERAIAAIVSWVKLHLQTEQKKTDFKPEGDIDTIASTACLTVVSYLNSVMDKIHNGLEGDNLHAVTLELAVRLHRVIYEHLHNFQFNSAGAMIAICDVKEYRSAVCGRGPRAAPPPAHSLFDALHALCNLLLVKPENLHQVCEGETLAELDHSILLNFIQLRADYKSHKLSTFLKGLA